MKTVNPRIQAQILQLPNSKLLWINSYLPTDNGDNNIEQLKEVLREIESVADSNEFDDILWGADMNWHRGRNTQHSDTVDQFIKKLGLMSMWKKYDCDFTHIHTDNKSISTIDHWMCNERLSNHIIECLLIHPGDNLSRHSPIMLKL